MKLRLKNVEKDSVVNSVKGSRKIDDQDNNTKFFVNGDKDIINKFKKKSFTAMVTFVAKLRRYMKIICREV